MIRSNMVPVNITSPHRTYFTCTGEHFLTRHSRTRLAVRHWRGVISIFDSIEIKHFHFCLKRLFYGENYLRIKSAIPYRSTPVISGLLFISGVLRLLKLAKS